jgi:Ca2+:H+ antiporter
LQAPLVELLVCCGRRLPPRQRELIEEKHAQSGMNGGDPSGKLKEDKLDVCVGGPRHYVTKSLNQLWFTNYLNLLILCTPFAALSFYGGGADGITFTLSLLAIAPFAERLSYVTEQLALHTSETLGGLLNATFGNVTELIVAFFALRRGMLRIVQVSLLGSILSNMLLVLGCAFFFGGLRYREQTFNRTACSLNSGLLMLSVMSLLFPMVLETTHSELSPESTLQVSRWVSVMLLGTYCCYLVFQLHTHRHIFEDGDEPGDGAEDDDEDEEEEEEAVLGMWGSIFWLAFISLFIAYLSEWLVHSLEGASCKWGVPDLFLGTIVIPIVGNAAEHAAAIIFAVKNKMELSLGIAVGSSTQIALFVVPLLVVIGWFYDKPLSMDFHPFETGTLLLTVILVAFLIQNGESNWLQGLMLIVAYAIVSLGFFVHCDQNGEADGCPDWSSADEL